ncbi:adaptor protein MecA [Lachnoclostridium phytofermentans]|uniref:Negative regulator of genetic competence sporulation and motility-like protein n=1 Tax=Lachnoclostridium phytofermentans (strain ATCC 700394 / DSM 18823 / ISDg) TaxID=357809 RepID=A9KKA8_LACP7|nr:adaptor protein MecA [Lachnoclostridium phytofermentans]ABX44099.1 Negative regulator of genetic competence sporulation and motility-like protein [Lachnoclostridium phytofermentans ISDg]
MKLEKISDTQIRCTLNKEDLMDRELRISELAYGSDKAKQLFREMMQQAAYEFGFEAEDIPLMIEATPVSADCLVLVITKVEDPDELDTRFSSFTPYASDDDDDLEEEEEEEDAYADEILNCFEHLGELLGKREKSNSSKEEFVPTQKQSEKQAKANEEFVQLASSLYKIFSFRNLSELTGLARIIVPFYQGYNTLYKNPVDSKYYLVVHISRHTPEDFNKVCNIISEYGKSEKTNYASISYYKEHYDVIIADKAIQKLSSL